MKEKDYQADPCIASDWRAVTHALKTAWTVTFFGYGAPKTDVEAIQLLKSGWGPVEKRELEETEIIDVRPENELTKTWSPFIHTHHFTIRRSFYDSFIGRHPRRSCEALWAQLMECRFIEGTQIPRTETFEELYDWYKPRLDVEAGC